MRDQDFARAVKEICRQDPRYPVDAYNFIREALEYTAKILDKPAKGEGARHVTGRELLEGIRNYAIEEYGPLTRTVLASWAITKTENFGDLVFHLVEAGILRKTEQDSAADFADGYDFNDAFVKPFLPRKHARSHRPAPGPGSPNQTDDTSPSR